MDDATKQAVIEILKQSDIVWPKYGDDTREDLAARILRKIEEIQKARAGSPFDDSVEYHESFA
jgi:hypothetical protein